MVAGRDERQWTVKEHPRPKKTQYSVLLLYPESVADFYGETYLAHVVAQTPSDAVKLANEELVKHNALVIREPAPTLLVVRGHHEDLQEET